MEAIIGVGTLDRSFSERLGGKEDNALRGARTRYERVGRGYTFTPVNVVGIHRTPPW